MARPFLMGAEVEYAMSAPERQHRPAAPSGTVAQVPASQRDEDDGQQQNVRVEAVGVEPEHPEIEGLDH